MQTEYVEKFWRAPKYEDAAHTDGTVSLERVILQEVYDDNVPLRFAFAKDLLPITPESQSVK